MDKDLELVPVYISVTQNDDLNQFLSPLSLDTERILSDVRPPKHKRHKTSAEICSALSDWLSVGKGSDIFSPVPDPLDMNLDLSLIREDTFKKFYQIKDDEISIISENQSSASDEEKLHSLCDIYISHSLRDQKYATFLSEYLKAKNLNVCCKSNINTSEEAVIDIAKCIVILLSQSYINSVKEVEQFNMILCRERQSQSGRLLYVIKTSAWTESPMYFSLVPCDTALSDEFWWHYGMAHMDVWTKPLNASIQETLKKLGHGLIQGELCPLLKAACDVFAIYKHGRYLESVRHEDIILHNIINVHQQAAALRHHTPHNTAPQEEIPEKPFVEQMEDELPKEMLVEQFDEDAPLADADDDEDSLGLPEPPKDSPEPERTRRARSCVIL